MRLLKCGVWALSCLIASPLAADIYRCTVTPFSDARWMPKEFLFRFNATRTQAEILNEDLARLSNVGVKRHSTSSLVMTWTKGITSPGGDGPAAEDRFRVVLNIDNLKVSVQVSEASDMGKLIRGAGGCEMVEQSKAPVIYRQVAGVI